MATTYLKSFRNYDLAYNWAMMKNKTSNKEVYALVDGHDNDFCVVDLRTAVELGTRYQIIY